MSMYVIIWEYQVRADRTAEFEKIYKSNGTWAELFRKGTGYISTELLRDKMQPQKYITVDQWHSAEDHETFYALYKKEYEALDAQCEGLTERESLFGKWETVKYETR